jgi:hypothetical protein
MSNMNKYQIFPVHPMEKELPIKEDLKNLLSIFGFLKDEQVLGIIAKLRIYTAGEACGLIHLREYLSNSDFVKEIGDGIHKVHKLIAIGGYALSKYSGTKTTQGKLTSTDQAKVIQEGTKMLLADVKAGTTRNWSAGKLNEFSGKLEDWLTWKENALSRFALSGLTQVLESKQFSLLNPDMNAAVHAMIRQCVSSQRKHIFLTATLAEKLDGHEAWKTLLGFYENGKGLDILIRLETDTLKNLEVKDGEDFQAFAFEFLHVVDRLTLMYQTMQEKKLNPSIASCNYVREFMGKIHVKHMLPRIETLKQKTDVPIREAFLELIACDMEYNLATLGCTTVPTKVNADAKQAPKAKPEAKVWSTPVVASPKPSIDMKAFYDKVKNLPVPEDKKNELLSTFRKGSAPNNSSKRSFGSQNKNAQKKKKRRASVSEATLLDYESWSKEATK